MESKQLSKAERYNNPGAIRPGKMMYEGQVDVDDEGFAIFATPEAGRRALLNQINIQIERGEDTVDKFLNRYTPVSKENPQASRDNYRVFLAEKLGLNSTNEPFPKNSTAKIADAITQFESGRFKSTQESDTSTTTEPSIEDRLKQLGKELPSAVETVAREFAEENPDLTRLGFDIAGAAAGARAGQLSQANVQKFEEESRKRLARERLERMRAASSVGAASAPPTAPVAGSQKPLSSGAANWTRAMGREIPDVLAEQAESMRKTDPRGGQAIIDRDIKAMEKIRAMGQGGYQLSGSGQSQLMLPRETAEARAAAQQMAQQPRQPSALSRMGSAMSQGARGAGQNINLLGRAFPGAAGALSGLGAAELGQEAYRRSQEGDDIGKYIAGIGAAGAAASLFPTLPTRVGGGAIATLSPLVLYLYDKMRKQNQALPTQTSPI